MNDKPKQVKKTASLPPLSGSNSFARLSRLYDIIHSLNSITQLDNLLNQIVASAADMLEAKGAALLLAESGGGRLRFEVTSGRDASHLKHMVLPIDERSVEGWVALHDKPHVENRIQYSSYLFGQAGQMNGYRAQKLVCVPLHASERGTGPLDVPNKLVGVLEVLDKVSGEDFNSDDTKLLESLADAVVIAIENVRLYEQERTQAQRLTQAFDELDKTYKATLQALTGLLDTRDVATHGHSVRVVAFTLRLAKELGITDPARLRAIEQGALLHDVGKIGVADAVLRKPGSLDDTEWEQMRSHPELGYTMLKDIAFLKEALAIVRYHHERWDGSGYPHGLKAEQIPLEARIFTVADAFDAITSMRPYSRARTYSEATAILLEESGRTFDPEVVQAFLRVPEDEWKYLRGHAMDR
jgi:putative nucleotidyltransferase with HDIG domain